jgi:hypothetical protein
MFQKEQKGNALKNATLALNKAFPMDTPKNLADSIFKAKGNASKGTKDEQIK